MDSKKLAIWSFILGLMSVFAVPLLILTVLTSVFFIDIDSLFFFTISAILFFFPMLGGIISIILGYKALKANKLEKTKEGRGFALWGIALGILGILLFVFVFYYASVFNV